jgi:hypothetical protein
MAFWVLNVPVIKNLQFLNASVFILPTKHVKPFRFNVIHGMAETNSFQSEIESIHKDRLWSQGYWRACVHVFRRTALQRLFSKNRYKPGEDCSEEPRKQAYDECSRLGTHVARLQWLADRVVALETYRQHRERRRMCNGQLHKRYDFTWKI